MKFNVKYLSLVGGMLACVSNVCGMESLGERYTGYLKDDIDNKSVIIATYDVSNVFSAVLGSDVKMRFFNGGIKYGVRESLRNDVEAFIITGEDG